ncbi:MAG: histidinol-phosphate transaminase [Aquificaceae bacterium]
MKPRIQAPERYKTETTRAAVRLSSNELYIDLPEEIREEIARELAFAPLYRYPDPEARELRSALSSWLGLPSEEYLTLGNGSDELINYICASLGTGPVSYPVPTFSMYGICARNNLRQSIPLELDENFELLKTPPQESDLVFIARPNNPTGNVFLRENINALRAEGRCIVIDEAYYPFCKDSMLKDALKSEDILILRTLSKIGLAGLRVGILIASPDIIKLIDSIRLPFNVTMPSQIVARIIIQKYPEVINNAVEVAIKERERMQSYMKKLQGIKVFPSKANFILFKVLVGAKALHRELLKRGVLIRDFSENPYTRECLRVSVGRAIENDMFLQALEESLRALY